MADTATIATTGPTAVTLVTAAAGTALQTWGSYAICLIGLGLMLWRAHAEIARLRTEAEALRAENKTLQDQRLEDVRKMISVTESSTALQQTRTQGDQLFLETMKGLAAEVATLRTKTDGVDVNQALIRQVLEAIDEPRRDGPGRRPTRGRDNR